MQSKVHISTTMKVNYFKCLSDVSEMKRISDIESICAQMLGVLSPSARILLLPQWRLAPLPLSLMREHSLACDASSSVSPPPPLTSMLGLRFEFNARAHHQPHPHLTTTMSTSRATSAPPSPTTKGCFTSWKKA
jgi:hypothetical protein